MVKSDSLDEIIAGNEIEQPILVYTSKKNLNNTNILIFTDRIKENNIEMDGFEFIFDPNKEKLLDSSKFNYIFADKCINNNDFYLLTYFSLNISVHEKLNNNGSNNKLKLVPFKYIKSKYIDNYLLDTNLNWNINFDVQIPDYVYGNRANFGKSKIIWAPSWNNISNDHFIIRALNKIGFEHYKRKTNLVDVVVTNDVHSVSKFGDDIKNPLNICLYQENTNNPLNMEKKLYFNWFFDSMREKSSHDLNSLYLSQFPFYRIKENVLRQLYGLPVDINKYYHYPNCFTIIFNINNLLGLLNLPNNNERSKSCYVLRKTHDNHPLKFVNSVKDYFVHPEDSINIENNSLDDNIQMFLRCEKFYCYDCISFLPVIATLCGCQAIIISRYPGLKDIRELNKVYSPFMYYGIAYEDTEEELKFARDTRPILINILENIYKNNFKNFFSEDNYFNSMLLFLKYLETFFEVSFYEN